MISDWLKNYINFLNKKNGQKVILKKVRPNARTVLLSREAVYFSLYIHVYIYKILSYGLL